jgi:probable HAF family extracellular repeat protein
MGAPGVGWIMKSKFFTVAALCGVMVGTPGLANANTVFEGLGFVPGYTTSTWAYDVSANGQVVVGSSYNATTNSTEAFRWTAATGMVGIGTGIAFGVNANGSVVVGAMETCCVLPPAQAFVWTAATGMVGLGAYSAANS